MAAGTNGAPTPARAAQRGITVLELDDSGKISRFTAIYDSYQFPDDRYRALGVLNLET